MKKPLSPTQESDPKKPKMSTTTSDDEEPLTIFPANPTIKPKYKRRKIALFFAYLGINYQGMQKNPGARTIEGDLEEALFQSGAIPEPDRGNPKKFDWARSARTDKGVSAVGQVVSGRFYVDPPGFIDRLNSNLPLQIRVFGFKRVTPSFNAKKFCDRRMYVYLIPVFALDPSSHPDRESVLSSLGSENELEKCLVCSEKGRKVEGVMGKRRLDDAKDESLILSRNSLNSVENDLHPKNENATLDCEVKGESLFSSENRLNSEIVKDDLHVKTENVSDILECEVKDKGLDCSENKLISAKVNVEIMPKNGDDLNTESENMVGKILSCEVKNEALVSLENRLSWEKVKYDSCDGFWYGEKERRRFNRILNYYVGTHNFHNFTTRTKSEDPAAQRFIVSFDASATVTVDGIEFVKCEVIGQSFMLHQIRKMIGFAVAIMRNLTPEKLIETALQKNVRINVPTAPEVGLFLGECFFTSYNNKWKDSHEEVSNKAYEKEADDFKMKHVYFHIASMEHKEGTVAVWLHSLNYRNYPDMRGDVNVNEISNDANTAL